MSEQIALEDNLEWAAFCEWRRGPDDPRAGCDSNFDFWAAGYQSRQAEIDRLTAEVEALRKDYKHVIGQRNNWRRAALSHGTHADRVLWSHRYDDKEVISHDLP